MHTIIPRWLDLSRRKFVDDQRVLYDGPQMAWTGRPLWVESLWRERDRGMRVYVVRSGRETILAREDELVEVR